MTFHDPHLNSINFQIWKIKWYNSMTFQVQRGGRGGGGGGAGIALPGNFANLGSLKCHFLHFDLIFYEFFYKVLTLVTHIIQNHKTHWEMLKISNFFPLFSEFYGKLGRFDKNPEATHQTGRLPIKSGELECLQTCFSMTIPTMPSGIQEWHWTLWYMYM